MRRRPRYQIFVSSTYSDLSDERNQVTWKLLKDRHIPAGMETFPAADDRGWETITRAIDESDYYILIVGWRYGSIDPEANLSWTHREYNYAKERGIPVLAFLRDEEGTTVANFDKAPDAYARITSFREEIKAQRLCKFWSQAQDLCNAVGEALWHRIHRDEDDGTERPGWFRGDAALISPEAVNEMARLSRENNELRTQIADLARVETAELLLSLASADRVLTQHQWHPWPDQFRLSTAPGAVTHTSAHTFKRWVDTLQFTLWLDLTVFNSGRTAASDVLVELTIPHGIDIRSRKVRPRDVGDVVLASFFSDEELSSTSDVFVQRTSRSEEGFTIRQRIKRVLGKSNEPLIYFGVVLDSARAWPTQSVVEISYTIRDFKGAATDGTLKVPFTVRQGGELSIATAQQFFDSQDKPA